MSLASSANPYAAPSAEYIAQQTAPKMSLPLKKLRKIRVLLICAHVAFVTNWGLFITLVHRNWDDSTPLLDILFPISLFASWLVVIILACHAHKFAFVAGIFTAALYWIPLVGLFVHLAVTDKSCSVLKNHGYVGRVIPRLSPEARANIENGFDLNTTTKKRSVASVVALWSFILLVFLFAMYANYGAGPYAL